MKGFTVSCKGCCWVGHHPVVEEGHKWNCLLKQRRSQREMTSSFTEKSISASIQQEFIFSPSIQHHDGCRFWNKKAGSHPALLSCLPQTQQYITLPFAFLSLWQCLRVVWQGIVSKLVILEYRALFLTFFYSSLLCNRNNFVSEPCSFQCSVI